MQIIFNNPKLKTRRRSLRGTQTKAEALVWNRLRNKQLGVKFFRQYSVGPFILDFYCPKKKIAIELNGSQHLDNIKYDGERTEYLNNLGIKVLRFWNNEVFDSLEAIIEKLYEECNSSNLT